MYHSLYLYLLLIVHISRGEVSETDLNEISEQQNAVRVNKCCEADELMVDSVCRLAEQYNQLTWTPQFMTEDGKNASVKHYKFISGLPDCGSTRTIPIYGFKNTDDELSLLVDGRMQHLIHHEYSLDSVMGEPVSNMFSLHGNIQIVKEPSSYIHNQGKYCMDKILITNAKITGLYAQVCIPEVKLKSPPK